MRPMYIAILFVILLLLPQATLAATWHVEQDGSGDFDDIQPGRGCCCGGRYDPDRAWSLRPGSIGVASGLEF